MTTPPIQFRVIRAADWAGEEAYFWDGIALDVVQMLGIVHRMRTVSTCRGQTQVSDSTPLYLYPSTEAREAHERQLRKET